MGERAVAGEAASEDDIAAMRAELEDSATEYTIMRLPAVWIPTPSRRVAVQKF